MISRNTLTAVCIGLATLGAGGGALAQPAAAASAAVAGGDRTFVMEAAKGGMAEVALGQLAQQRGSSDAVKQFGSRMVDDHTKANDELKQIAMGKGITLADATPPKDAQARKLEGLSGAAFDREYMTKMHADHRKTIALFEKEAQSGRDPELKAFAAKTLPTLQEHLKMVQHGKPAASH